MIDQHENMQNAFSFDEITQLAFGKIKLPGASN